MKSVFDKTYKILCLQMEIEKNFKKSLDDAIEIGRLLFNQKKNSPHDKFTAWINENVPFGGKTVENYIGLYKNKNKDILKAESVLALYPENILRAKAKENQKTSTGGTNPQLLQNSAKAAPIDTRQELATALDVKA